MDRIWKSGLSKDLKIRLLTSTVELVLVHRCEAWNLSMKQAKGLDGCYIRMLRKTLHIRWNDHLPNEHFRGKLPRISETI